MKKIFALLVFFFLFISFSYSQSSVKEQINNSIELFEKYVKNLEKKGTTLDFQTIEEESSDIIDPPLETALDQYLVDLHTFVINQSKKGRVKKFEISFGLFGNKEIHKAIEFQLNEMKKEYFAFRLEKSQEGKDSLKAKTKEQIKQKFYSILLAPEVLQFGQKYIEKEMNELTKKHEEYLQQNVYAHIFDDEALDSVKIASIEAVDVYISNVVEMAHLYMQMSYKNHKGNVPLEVKIKKENYERISMVFFSSYSKMSRSYSKYQRGKISSFDPDVQKLKIQDALRKYLEEQTDDFIKKLKKY